MKGYRLGNRRFISRQKNPKEEETSKGGGKPGPQVKNLEEVKRQESYDRRIWVKLETV
jgi:hypothetical protein